jgi:hypothetical protein
MLKLISLATGLLLAASTIAAAETPPTPTRGLMRYDTNHDGFVDHAEWTAAQEARFKQLDTNGDGKLTKDEMFVGNGAPATDRQMQRQAGYFRLLDTDKDGFVSKAEFMAQAERNFARCDLDKDGRINTAECRQALRRKPVEPARADR